MHFNNQAVRFFILSVTFLILGGCVTGTRQLDLSSSNFENEKTAHGEIFLADIGDNRHFEQNPRNPSTPSVDGVLTNTPPEKLATLIGRQRNGFGKAMGDIALPNGGTVQGEMKKLLTTGLESRGYKIVDSSDAPIKLEVDIEKFWAWFSPGFWAISFESEVETKLHFNINGQEKNFTVTGYGINKGQVASNANWELAYRRAMDQYLSNLDKLLDSEGL